MTLYFPVELPKYDHHMVCQSIQLKLEYAGPTLSWGTGGPWPPIFDAKPNRKSIFGKFVEEDL